MPVGSSVRRVARGHILLVQEGRFRLLTDEGKGLLLTLSHDANATIADLQRYHREHRHVTVEYSGEANLASGAAHNVTQSEE
jgi:hypothetical protein